VDEVEIFARRRRIADRKAAEKAEREEWERRRLENPEEFVPMQEVWNELSRRLKEKEMP
jgi:hypothetical protein